MNITGVSIVVVFLLIIGFFVFITIRSTQNDVEVKQQIARNMGFTPISADTVLSEKIFALYQRKGALNKYKLRNVSQKRTPDGDIYLFDLINTSGEDDSSTENQAVAVISPRLHLPSFTLFPKSDEKYKLSGITNKILEWGTSLMLGNPVPFQKYPTFNARYIITSDQQDLVYGFIDENIAHYFSKTQMYSLHADKNIFTFSELEPLFNTNDSSSMNRRVNRAVEIFRMLQK